MRTAVWITGASGGIGAALATTCPYEGADLVDVSRSGGTPGTTHVKADLADPAAWGFVAARLAAALAESPPDRLVFIHNAATLDPIGPAGAQDPAAYTSAALLNSAAPQVLGNAVLAAVEAAGIRDATLVQLSSGAASSPYAGWSTYCAGKAAVDMWVRTVGLEQAGRPHPVRVLAIAPGVVQTGMQAAIRQQDPTDFPQVERFRELHEQGRLADPTDAARAMWSLITDREVTTGSVLDVRDARDGAV
jgi:NAD(P)-dependent dehydrogenase (short-subunit alcohol dehydrogenase family)